MLADDRGDSEEAERLYRQSLQIEERLGNQAGIATSYSAFGDLSFASGAVEAAVGWHAKALVLRLRLQAPEAQHNLQRLNDAREKLDVRTFAAVLDNAFGAEEVSTIFAALASWTAQSDLEDP